MTTMPATVMKAIVTERYGSPPSLECREIAKPAVAEDGVLVRACAASINPADWRPLSGKPYLLRLVLGLRRPKSRMVGVDLAGVVEEVGPTVTQFRPGDEVFGARTGAFAEYVAGRERNFVLKPAGLTFEEAAALPVAGCTALQALRDHGQIQPGQRVLVNGAAGGVGTFTVQIAKAFGAHVTAVCSGGNVDMVCSIGADTVVDYTRSDFARSGQRYDLVVDNVGNRTLRDLRRVLMPKGTLVVVGAPKSNWLLRVMALPIKTRLLSRFVDQRMTFFIAKLKNEDLVTLKDMVEAGKLNPVIDRTYPLSQISEAVRYVQGGHARAKVVITI